MKRKFEKQIEDQRTPKGGFDQVTLAAHGISFPPPKGWKKKLIEEHDQKTPFDLDERMDLYEDVLNAWGLEAQLDMVVEECAELIQAVQKMKRKGLTNKEAIEGLVDETADVIIMTEQIKLWYGEDPIMNRVDFKIKRLRKRLGT